MSRKLFFLIGLPACGKTTLGRAVAERSEAEFVDLDEAIEKREGMSVSEIFAIHGEDYFRRLESETLREIAEKHYQGACIVGCGGGTPCNPENMALMKCCGHVVYLVAEREIALRRLLEAPIAQRPMVQRAGGNVGKVTAAYERLSLERAECYSQAHSRFDSSRLDTLEEIEETVERFKKEYLAD